MSNVSVELDDVVVVDDSVFSRMNYKAKEEFIRSVPAEKQTVFVESFMKAKDLNGIRTAALNGENVQFRVALLAGRSLTEEETKTVSDLEQCITAFNTLLGARRPSYPFADVPEGRSIEKFVWNKRSVKRQRGDYAINFSELERLWKRTAPVWAGLKPNGEELHVTSTSGYSKTTVTTDKRVTIGCQYIDRWELEQIALKLNFAFPDGTKVD